MKMDPDRIQQKMELLNRKLTENTIEEDRTWSIQDFQIGRCLGEGQFGRVYLAREKKTEYMVGIKAILKSELTSSRMQHQVLREVEIQWHLNHPNIIALFNYFWDTTYFCLIIEFAGGGDVFDKLQRAGSFTDEIAAKYSYQVSDALSYCHRKCVMHRDIKPENLLLDVNDNIKMADFGWSVHAPSLRRNTKCGTLDYLPPEMVQNKKYDYSVDLWCLGVLTYEFLVGRPPFESVDEETTCNKILEGHVPYPNNLSESAIDCISRLIKINPDERIAISVFQKLPWVTQNYTPPKSL